MASPLSSLCERADLGLHDGLSGPRVFAASVRSSPRGEVLQVVGDVPRIGRSTPPNQNGIPHIIVVVFLQLDDLDKGRLLDGGGQTEQGDVVDDEVGVVVGVDDDVGHFGADSAVGVELVDSGDDAVVGGVAPEKQE